MREYTFYKIQIFELLNTLQEYFTQSTQNKGKQNKNTVVTPNAMNNPSNTFSQMIFYLFNVYQENPTIPFIVSEKSFDTKAPMREILS